MFLVSDFYRRLQGDLVRYDGIWHFQTLTGVSGIVDGKVGTFVQGVVELKFAYDILEMDRKIVHTEYYLTK